VIKIVQGMMETCREERCLSSAEHPLMAGSQISRVVFKLCVAYQSTDKTVRWLILLYLTQ